MRGAGRRRRPAGGRKPEGGRKASTERLGKDGDLEACRGARASDSAPPSGCGALLALTTAAADDPATAPLRMLRAVIIFSKTGKADKTSAAFIEAIKADYSIALPLKESMERSARPRTRSRNPT